MYLDHFGLKEFPFRITPDPAFLFWTPDHQRAFDLLMRAARDDIAVTTIIGEPGTGKTTLMQHFIAGLPADMRVGMISNYSSGLGGLGHWLHWAFDLRPDGPGDELAATFASYLTDQHREGRRCLLIVDEAQNVSDGDIAALTDLTRLPAVPGVSLRLVLAGQPLLRRRLPEAGGQGPDGPFQLRAMTALDTRNYILHRMAISGCHSTVFDDGAVQHIARLTDGVPRLVNVLCELLLTSAFGAGERQIGKALVDQVLQDAQQTGMLDHLLAAAPLPGGTGASEPISSRPHVRSDGSAEIAVPHPLESALIVPAPDPKAAPSPSDGLSVPPTPTGVARGFRRRNHRAGATLVAAGLAAAAVVLIGFVGLPVRHDFDAASASIAGLRTDDTRASQLAAALPTTIRPALAPPDGMTGTNATELREQALRVGPVDPLAAAIGFARAALRGDARAAYYLGQHFEAGDGVSRNPALAIAWYDLAAPTQRSARRALQTLADSAAGRDALTGTAPTLLLGLAGGDDQAEFIWAAADDGAARFMIELADTPGSPALQLGPFGVSGVLLDPAPEARLWRVMSINSAGAPLFTSEWHLIKRDDTEAIAAAP